MGFTPTFQSSTNPRYLKHYAESLVELQKEKKQKQYLFEQESTEQNLFCVKRKRYKIFYEKIPETYSHFRCISCFMRQKQESTQTYYCNILDLNHLFFLRGKQKQMFKNCYLMCQNVSWNIDTSEKTLKNELLTEYVEEYCREVDEHSSTSAKLWDCANSMIVGLKYGLSKSFFRIFGFYTYLLFGKIMDRLLVFSSEIEALKKSQESDDPVVYLSTNRSCLDSLVILFTLYYIGLKPPIVIHSANKRLPLPQWISGKLGIVRHIPLDIRNETIQEAIREETLIYYIDDCLKQGNHVLFCLDENYADTGIITNPSERNALLEFTVSSLQYSKTTNVTLVPVDVTYEKIIETYSEENRVIPNLFSFDVWKKKLGIVHVSFMNPISTKDFITTLKQHMPSTEEQINDLFSQNGEITKQMMSHISYDFCKASALTTTNIISFLFMTKFRNGVTLPRLVEEVEKLCGELRDKRCRMGFVGKAEDVTKHALEMLGPKLIERVDEQSLKPNLKLPEILELSYYSNGTLSHFVLDAVVVQSLTALVKDSFDDLFKSPDVRLVAYHRQIVAKSEELCDILQFEYAFEKSCQSLFSDISVVITKMTERMFLVKKMQYLTEEEEWGHRVATRAGNFEFTDDEDSDDDEVGRFTLGDEYTASLAQHDIYEDIYFNQRRLLQPFIRCYLKSADHLHTLLDGHQTKETFFKSLLDKMNSEREIVHSIDGWERVSLCKMKNSMKLFEKWEIVKTIVVDDVECFLLTERYLSEAASIVSKLKCFLI